MMLSWIITTTTYGSWLPGDERGSVGPAAVGRSANQYGEPYAEPDVAIEARSQGLLKCPPIRLTVEQSESLMSQFHETTSHRRWCLHAVAIMANHWHVVLSAEESVRSEAILAGLKSYGSRRLNGRWGRPASDTWWTESGSRRRLPAETNVHAAIRYVAEQEYPLVLWVHREFEWLVPESRRDVAIQRWRQTAPAEPGAGGASPLSPDRLPSNGSTTDNTESGDLRPPLRKAQSAPNQGTHVPRSEGDDLRQLDNAHVWHPFTAMAAYRDEHAPIIVEADGFHLIDTEGRRYLDGHSSLWCNIHGHRVPAIDAAIRSQLDHVAHSTLLGLANEPSIELAAELVRRTPAGLNKVFYADCGAAGVEVALKIAYQYHRQKPGGPEERDLFVCLDHAYHGDTVGTISLGGIDRFHSLFGSLMFPALRVPSPGRRCQKSEVRSQNEEAEGQAFAELEQTLAENSHRIAGFVMEPLVQAAAGILVHPPGYLKRVRELTRQYGIPLIADEIAVGFGRTGTLFACEQEDVSPDILILSKGLTGGYLPLAATLVTDEIYDAFLGDPWSGRTFHHGHTYTGNPLACAAALASLRLIDEHDVVGNARRIEAVLRRELSVLAEPGNSRPPLRGTTAHVAEVRQKGAMVGIELVQEREPLTPFAPGRRIGHQVTLACRRRGVVLRNIGDVIVLMPAPAMPEELVVELCRAVNAAIADVMTVNS